MLRDRRHKYSFNWSPVYIRTTAKIVEVSDELHYINSMSLVDEKQNKIATFNKTLYIADIAF